jgi:hypothetical protein
MKKLLCTVIFALGLPVAKDMAQPDKLYKHKTGTLTYIETKKGEAFSVCPEKNAEGMWASDYSVSITQNNCVVLKSPQITGTFYLAFISASGRIDTTQVLVNQAYIDMSKYSHKVWRQYAEWEGSYEPYAYTQPLVVDKTETTLAEAHYFSQNIDKRDLEYHHYPKGENIETSQRPYFGGLSASLVNERSKADGLDIVYRKVPKSSEELNKLPGDRRNCVKECPVMDTNSNGYRLPTRDEWSILMRAGASTKYYWGDSEDSATVSKYAWVRPKGAPKPVAQLLPNQFGLYDMISPNNPYADIYRHNDYSTYDETCPRMGPYQQKPECLLQNSLARRVEYMGIPLVVINKVNRNNPQPKEKSEKTTPSLQKIGTVMDSKSIRFLRKSPKMEKLDKF